jgi:hypothetical protein
MHACTYAVVDVLHAGSLRLHKWYAFSCSVGWPLALLGFVY